MTPTTTPRLIERLKAHDPTAVADLSSAYGAKIYQLAFRYLRNREDAEEVAQDVLLKVYQKIDAFRGDAALSSWIYRITFNAAMSRLREFKQDLPLAPERPESETIDTPVRETCRLSLARGRRGAPPRDAAGAGARAQRLAGCSIAFRSSCAT